MPDRPTAGVSYAQTQPVTCPACGRGFDFAIWLIVDTGERPDLLARIRGGTLHDVICPHCNGQIGQLDAPLLLYIPSPFQGEGRGGGGSAQDAVGAHGRAPLPRLLFSPAQRTTAEQDREQAAGLVNLLRGRLGAAWRDEWLMEGLPAVAREHLPAALSDDPVGAQGLALLLQAFINADTWAESQRIVEQHPELLTDEADDWLARLVEGARAQGDENAVRVLEEHRALLRRCREVGIARAFAEKMLPPEALAAAEAANLSPTPGGSAAPPPLPVGEGGAGGKG